MHWLISVKKDYCKEFLGQKLLKIRLIDAVICVHIRYIFSLIRFVMSNSMLFCFLLSHKSSTGNYKFSPSTQLYKMLRGLLIYWFKYPQFSTSNISFNQFVKNLSTGSKSKSEREKNHSCRQEVRDIWCFLQVLFTIRNFNLKS